MTSWLVFNSAHEWLVLKRPVTREIDGCLAAKADALPSASRSAIRRERRAVCAPGVTVAGERRAVIIIRFYRLRRDFGSAFNART
jgi:hypothetical protein